MIEYRGEQFSGYNKPKRTPNHPKKSHAVLAKEGETVKLIRIWWISTFHGARTCVFHSRIVKTPGLLPK